MGPNRPAPHTDRDYAREIVKIHQHLVWRHRYQFSLCGTEHLLPGEGTLHRVSYWVAARIIKFWMGRLVDPEELGGLARIRWRHLWGDFRLERKAHLTEQTSVSYKTGFDDGIRYVYAQLERKLVDQEFPIR